MDIGEIAKKVDALEAELVAKCSSIADLEARVSLLEAENARLRKAMPDGEAMDHAGERKEEGVAVDVNKGQSAEEGIHEVPTPVKCPLRVVTFSDDEDNTKEAGGGGGGDHGGDDLSSIPRGKKRKSALMISDSESEDENGEGHGSEDLHVVSPKHASCVAETVIGMEEGDEDDGKTINEFIKETREDRMSRDDGELGRTKGCSTPATRDSTWSAKSQSKKLRRALKFDESKDHEESEDGPEEHDTASEFMDDADCSENTSAESEDGPEEDDSTSEFIDDADCFENTSVSAEEYHAELAEAIDRIRGKKNANNKDWETEQEMRSAFDEHPELTLKAVCALYRKQTEEEQLGKATIVLNKRGFNQIDAPRGSRIAQFLLDGDASGPLKKTAQDLEKYGRGCLQFCLKVGFRYSNQLFRIYRKKEDPYFP